MLRLLSACRPCAISSDSTTGQQAQPVHLSHWLREARARAARAGGGGGGEPVASFRPPPVSAGQGEADHIAPLRYLVSTAAPACSADRQSRYTGGPPTGNS